MPLNLRRRPFLCTTLYRNPMQVSNFGGTFDQLFLWIFLWNFHRRCLSTSSIPWCKTVKNDQKLKSRGGGGSCLKIYQHVPCSSTMFRCSHAVGLTGRPLRSLTKRGKDLPAVISNAWSPVFRSLSLSSFYIHENNLPQSIGLRIAS